MKRFPVLFHFSGKTHGHEENRASPHKAFPVVILVPLEFADGFVAGIQVPQQRAPSLLPGGICPYPFPKFFFQGPLLVRHGEAPVAFKGALLVLLDIAQTEEALGILQFQFRVLLHRRLHYAHDLAAHSAGNRQTDVLFELQLA